MCVHDYVRLFHVHGCAFRYLHYVYEYDYEHEYARGYAHGCGHDGGVRDHDDRGGDRDA